MLYSKERLAVALTVYTSRMNILTIVVLLIWFKMVKLHYLDRVIRQFSGFNITHVDFLLREGRDPTSYLYSTDKKRKVHTVASK
ncbi:hypothetical protein POPTR_002G020850v4 [Populus trichocarpa]|uniref:Transmembrane protein n=1 Tax=Populus trichocarpa TaxID=3694 RepID=A0A3N7ENE3_POPTR|nr:hypothetical protein POPTR_002G020850v4 [Populus trichocarpa]